MVWVLFTATSVMSLLGMWLLWQRGEVWRGVANRALAVAEDANVTSLEWEKIVKDWESLYEQASSRADTANENAKRYYEVALRWQSLYASANERADRAQAIAQSGQREDA